NTLDSVAFCAPTGRTYVGDKGSVAWFDGGCRPDAQPLHWKGSAPQPAVLGVIPGVTRPQPMPDGRTLLLRGFPEGGVVSWDVRAERPAAPRLAPGWTGLIAGSPDGARVV